MEFEAKDLVAASRFEKVESFEILHLLRFTPVQFAALVRAKFSDKTGKIEDLFATNTDSVLEHELLEKDKNGFATYFVSRRSPTGRRPARRLSAVIGGGYLSSPFEFKDGRLKIALLGNHKQLRTLFADLDKAHLHCRVLSLMDARYSPSSPLSGLTEKQREVLTKAHQLGYYDVPRRIGSRELSRELGLSRSTLSAHVRKAERRLITRLLSES